MESTCPDQGRDAAEQTPPSAVSSAAPTELVLKDATIDAPSSKKQNLTSSSLAKDKNNGDMSESVDSCRDSDTVGPSAQPFKKSAYLVPILSHSQPASPTQPLSPQASTPSSPGSVTHDGGAGPPGTVRRPMNAFLIFCKRHRAAVRETNPELDNRSVTRVLGDLWSKLGPEKATYTNLAKQNKEAFLKANPNFKWSGDRVQTGSARSTRKADSGGLVKQQDTTLDGASSLPKSDGTSVNTPATASDCSLQASNGQPVMQPSTKVDEGSKEQGQPHALLQLAEMCSSELVTTEANRPSTAASSSPAMSDQALSLRGPMSSPSLVLCESANVSNLGPLKKRAKHWGKSDVDSAVQQYCDSEKTQNANAKSSERNACQNFDDMKPSATMKGSSLTFEFQQSARETLIPAGPKFAVRNAGVPMSVSNMSRSQELPTVYTHPSSDLYDARERNWSKEGDFNPLNLSLPRAQDSTGSELVTIKEKISALSSEPSQRPCETNFTPGANPIDRSSFGDTYSSVEWYKSANHRYRKVSSSATESIPSFSPPPTHFTNDDGSLDLSGATTTFIPSSRWYQRVESGEKFKLCHTMESDGMDPKFFPTINKHTNALTERVPANVLGYSCPSSDCGPPATSIVARMMMQQPHQQDVLGRAGSDYFPSSHSPSLGSGSAGAPPSSSRQDTLSKLLAHNVPTSSAKSSHEGSVQNHNSDFHQWRDPQSTTLKLDREEVMDVSNSKPSLTLASFVARHQLPLAVPSASTNGLLSSAKNPSFSAMPSLSLPVSGSRMNASMATSLTSSSLAGPLSNPAAATPTVYRQADVTTVSLDTQATPQEMETMQDSKLPPPILERALTCGGSYSEGKLKKKWTQRMLVEEKMEEDRNRLLLLRASEESKKTLNALEGSSLASSMSHTSSDVGTTVETPTARLAFVNSSPSIMPRHVSYPSSKNGNCLENSPTFSESSFLQSNYRLTSQTVHGVVNNGDGTTPPTNKIYSTYSSGCNSSPLNNHCVNSVVNLESSSANTNEALFNRVPLSGSSHGTSASSILSSCLMAKQPLAAVKSSMSTLASPSRSFNASSHPKLMLQLSKGTVSSPALFDNSSLTASTTAPPATFQPLASSITSYQGKTNDLSGSPTSSSGLFTPSPLLPLTSNSLLLPSSSPSPLLVISSSIGQSSDTLKVDLGAGGWRSKSSPTLGEDQVERHVSMKESVSSNLVLPSSAGCSVPRLISSDSKLPQHAPSEEPLGLSKLEERSQKPEKSSSRKSVKGSRKKNGGPIEAVKELHVNQLDNGNVTRGTRKKKEPLPDSGEATNGDKPKVKRGRRKTAKKDLPSLTTDQAASQTNDHLAKVADASLLDKMRILNPIAACGKKIVDHIVEQFVKSDFGDSFSDKQDPFFGGSYSHENGSLFSRSGDGLRTASNLDNIVVRTLAGGDRFKLDEKIAGDVKPSVLQDGKKSEEEKYSWGKVKEEPKVKHESAIFSGLRDHQQNFKTEEGAFKPQLKLFKDAELWKKGKINHEDKLGWPSKMFAGPEAPSLSLNVKTQDSKEKIFGGNRAWMGEADGRERHLFPACSLVERVVREVCGSSPEKKNCFSCQRKEELPVLSKPCRPDDTNLTKVQDLMLGKMSEPGRNFPSPAVPPDQKSSVWNTYRQSNDSPTNEDSTERKPVLLAAPNPPQNSQQWKNGKNSSDDSANGSGRSGCLSMADLIEHHIHQEEVEDHRRLNHHQAQAGEEEEEEEEEQLYSQPLRKSRRANRGQKYQELIKEGFIQPSRDRQARGSCSQDDPVDVAISLEQKRGLKRRASERDVLSTAPPLLVGGLSRSSSLSSQYQSEARKSMLSFGLEKETEEDLTAQPVEIGPEKKRKHTDSNSLGRSSNCEVDRQRRGSKGEDISQHERSLWSSGGDEGPIRENYMVLKCEETEPKEAPKISAGPSVAVTGSRKRKARKHCITRISVVGQVSESESTTSKESSEQRVNECKDSGEVSKSSAAGFGSGDVKPVSALSSASSGSVLISPACKDLISLPSEKTTGKHAKPVSSGSLASGQGECPKQATIVHQDSTVHEQKFGADFSSKSGKTCQDDLNNASQQQASDSLQSSGSEVDKHKSMKMATNADTKPKKSTYKKENRMNGSQDQLPKSELSSTRGCPQTVELIEQTQSPHILLPSNNYVAVPPSKNEKVRKEKNTEGLKPKKASKLRKALLTGQTEVSKSSSASDQGSIGNADANKNVPAGKGKRGKSENGKSKSPAAKKPRKNTANPEDNHGSQGKKPKSPKTSPGSNKDIIMKKASKRENSKSSSVPNHSPLYSSSAQVTPLLTISCQTATEVSSPQTSLRNSQTTSTPKPKSAILSAILASAPMVDRPTMGLGGTYVVGKPLDLMSAPSAPGLKTVGGLGFSGSPKSPGQADTAESGHATGLHQASSSPSEVTPAGLGNTSSYLPHKPLQIPYPNMLSSKKTSQDKLRLASNEETTTKLSSARHSSSALGAVTTLSLSPPSLKSSTGVGKTSSTLSSWQPGSGLFLKSPTSKAVTVTTTALPQSVRGSPALPVAASSDAAR